MNDIWSTHTAETSGCSRLAFKSNAPGANQKVRKLLRGMGGGRLLGHDL